MTGEDVRTVQAQLVRHGQPQIAQDGVYGPKTRDGVIAFQRATSLPVDGIVGPQTWAQFWR
jgi:peptidoglycan hydrolase-like protein with peptidoglycan-binding domain